ncbi:MAG: D-alanyl-D-alanine carboxypeptidase/D-alanyl-D-alanine-endopeptidase, partial [Gemmatimonadota bacterium]|nr:D-alanyl-D-alanine carboxypeptidase/D-alanyl-D-alanine-endopeptidase [Gemmatimonadota bacterium]
GASWSALAVSLQTGDTLFMEGADVRLAPASNVKLLTTAAAFHHLGSDFRFGTYVLSRAAPSGGVVDGDIILFGTGDPSLSGRFTRGSPEPLAALADELVAQGITRIRGDLVADGSFLNGPGRSPEWPVDDLDDWYSAPVSGLSFNENLVTLRTTPALAPGGPPVVSIVPEVGQEHILNEATTRPGRGRPDLVITRTEYDGPIRVVGSISSAQRPIWKRMTVTDPTRFAGQAFLGILAERGIRIDGALNVVSDPEGSPLRAAGFTPTDSAGFLHTLATYEGPPLRDYLEVVNRTSHNFFAESVFKTLGRVVAGRGTFNGGRIAVDQFLSTTAGVPPDHVLLRDGSGLSPRNEASASAFVRLLTWMVHSDHEEEFKSTLPVAGQRRGLGRMYRTAAAGNLRAKTGTIERVSALSGYVTARNGEEIAFSVISNGIRSPSQAKRLEDQLAVALANWSGGPISPGVE